MAAMGRSQQARDVVQSLGAFPVSGDVTEPETLTSLFADAEVVFHVAGVNEMCSLDRERMWLVNVEGTRHVFETAVAAGVRRVVHTSSVVTIGEDHGVLADESTSRRRPYLSEYEASKAAAEELALSFSASVETIVVNPSSVQGPGRATGTGRLLLAAARGKVPFAMDATISLVDIDDCAAGHILAATHGAPGERYILSGSTTSVRDVLALISAATGSAIRPWYVKPAAIRTLAPLVEALFTVFGKQPPLCRESARVLTSEHLYDGGKAGRELGLAYTPMEETIAKTVDWVQA